MTGSDDSENGHSHTVALQLAQSDRVQSAPQASLGRSLTTVDYF